MKKRQIFINAAMSVIQTVIISVVLFVLYKYLLNTIGVKQLGIWSLVLATTSVTQIANLGLSGSIVKFVAKYIARGEYENVSDIIQTVTLSVGIFIGVALLIGYPIVKWVLGLVIPAESIPIALSVLPYALLALWIMVITGVFQAGLDGYQRIDIRSYLLIAGAVLNLLLCFLFVPKYGLMGVAYARIIQNITIFLSSWFLLKRYLPLLPVFPYKWNKRLFKETINYGINFQIISVTRMFYDPVTKALLSKFGGLSMVGYYAMANNMITQLRALIVSANQVLVPAIADLKEKTPQKIKSVYITSYQLLFYLALPLFSLIAVYTPLISKLWIGHYERIFIVSGTLLAIGWFGNTLSVPAYFSFMGIGDLRWNVIGQVSIALVNAGVGFLLGILLGGTGVVIGWVLSLALGSCIIYISYNIIHKIHLTQILPEPSRMISIVCLFGTFFICIIQSKFNYTSNATIVNSIIILLFSLTIFVLLWLHPMRKRIMGWILSELLNKKSEKGFN